MSRHTEAIQRLHENFAAATARARRDFNAARALRADLRAARERELATEQSRRFDAFMREVEEHLEALRAHARDMAPRPRLTRGVLEKAEYRERARAARAMIEHAEIPLLRSLAKDATARHDVGTLAGIQQVLDARAGQLDPEDGEVRALRADIERWALPDYEEARAALLLGQALAARARVAGPWQDMPGALLANPMRYATAFREAAVVEREALEATPFRLADVEALLGGVPEPAGVDPAPDEYDFASALGALTAADASALPTLDGLRGAAA
jgi:hypothetical protein